MKTQEEYFNDLKKGTSLVELQNYINNVLEIRGCGNRRKLQYRFGQNVK